jgi:hypothetical protein
VNFAQSGSTAAFNFGQCVLRVLYLRVL